MNIGFFLILLFFLGYFVFLSFNLLGLPLYLDEGIYIFWAYLFSSDKGLAYASMQDGKTPLFVWMTSWVNQLFNNFLLSGRFISVGASFISLCCWAFIGFKTYGKKILPFVILIFLITPFNIMISRLAFVDSLLIAFGSLSILGLFLLRESILAKKIFISLILAFFVGLILGLAFLTKTTAKIFLAAEVLLITLWVTKHIKERNFKGAALLISSGVILLVVYFEIIGYLKFGALKHWEMIANKESVLIFSLSDIYRKFFLEQDFSTHIKNLPISAEYFLVYFGVILLFFVLGVYRIFKTGKDFWILVFTLILGVGVFLSAKVPASRYFAIIIPEVLVISAIGLFWVWQKKSKSFKNY